ncbi:hypothetical protein KTR9_5364 (plasmid) [Gordonia sp. KTR9]|nr:hypothetical protein KTR9_5364 [Gordonia sp. KTR9]
MQCGAGCASTHQFLGRRVTAAEIPHCRAVSSLVTNHVLAQHDSPIIYLMSGYPVVGRIYVWLS